MNLVPENIPTRTGEFNRASIYENPKIIQLLHECVVLLCFLDAPLKFQARVDTFRHTKQCL